MRVFFVNWICFLTAAGERGGEVYREQFVAGWQSTPLRFIFPRGAQRAAVAAAASRPFSDSPHVISTPIIPPKSCGGVSCGIALWVVLRKLSEA